MIVYEYKIDSTTIRIDNDKIEKNDKVLNNLLEYISQKIIKSSWSSL